MFRPKLFKRSIVRHNNHVFVSLSTQHHFIYKANMMQYKKYVSYFFEIFVW